MINEKETSKVASIGNKNTFDVTIKNEQIRSQRSVDIVFKNISYSVKTKQGQKEILKNLNGILKAGRVTAILGASGAGKTSLLNLLCKRINPTKQGGILIGETLANQNLYNQEQFNEFAAYVMQDDVLIETMTVKECFQFAANLKLSSSAQEKEEKVESIIRSLRLKACENTFIGGIFLKGISGGEKKRTSIGYELISDPAAILLDEPTSGLDSFTAFSIISLLKEFAVKDGKTIAFTIHQPSSDIWGLFDSIMLMVEGKFIYQGKGGESIVKYFSDTGFSCPIKSNPADYLMQIMHSESEVNQNNYQTLFNNYEKNLMPQVLGEIKEVVSQNLPSRRILTSFSYQMAQIALRQVKILQRNKFLFKAKFFQSIFMGLFMGAIYWQIPGPGDNPTQRDVNNKSGFMFFLSVGMFMMSLNPCLMSFPQQRAVFLREENAKLYSVAPYFFGKLLVDIVPSILFPNIMGIIVYFMVGMNQDDAGKILFFLLTVTIQSCTGLGLGFLGGTAFNQPKVATAIAPLINLPFMLFAGFYKNSGDLAKWIGWIQYISPFKYSFNSLAVNEYTSSVATYPQNPIETLNFSLSKWESLCCLASLFVFFIFISFFLLSSLKKRVQ